jgi:hypothetical protein
VKRHRADLTELDQYHYTDKPDRLAEPLNYTNTSANRSTNTPQLSADDLSIAAQVGVLTAAKKQGTQPAVDFPGLRLKRVEL